MPLRKPENIDCKKKDFHLCGFLSVSSNDWILKRLYDTDCMILAFLQYESLNINVPGFDFLDNEYKKKTF